MANVTFKLYNSMAYAPDSPDKNAVFDLFRFAKLH
jgi:hypothetical protein